MDAPPQFIHALRDHNKLEVIVPCVGFDDLLDFTLPRNIPHADRLIVVTSHTDAKTVQVCRKYGSAVVQTDLFDKTGMFDKGAGISAGMLHFRYRGWRLLLDADILLPDSFRRVLLNHTALDTSCLYGADRVDVIGPQSWTEYAGLVQWGLREEIRMPLPLRGRVLSSTYGYLPLGYFQLWHAEHHRDYPSTVGGAGLDDIVFAQLWPDSHRRLLPSAIVYHLCVDEPVLGQNWDGIRRMRRTEEAV